MNLEEEPIPPLVVDGRLIGFMTVGRVIWIGASEGLDGEVQHIGVDVQFKREVFLKQPQGMVGSLEQVDGHSRRGEASCYLVSLGIINNPFSYSGKGLVYLYERVQVLPSPLCCCLPVVNVSIVIAHIEIFCSC